MMDGGTANAASAAHSTPGSHPGPVMNTAQGSDKMPSQTQTPDMPMAARMLEVYFHQPDGPYYAGVRTQRQNQVPLGNVPGLSSAFQHYRTTYVPPSESSIVSPSNATDSGYMSAPRHSVGIPSTYGGDLDHFTDTQSMTGRLEEVVLFPSNLPSFPVDHGSQPNANINSWAQDGERPMPSNTNNQAPETTHACSTCGQGFRTPSDLKKHVARHTRPHHCRVPNCQRTKGFSTANDLARHTRSRHPNTATAQGHFYKCNKGPCANASKLWPRADNFRQHLMRKHHYPPNIDNIDEFLYSGPEPAADPGDNGPADLHIPNACADPATIHSLTSRALGDPVGLDDRQVDTRMAHSNSHFSHHVSTMVGIQFSDMPLAGNGTGQIELHQPDDGQTTHSGHEELHLDPAMPQRLFSVSGSDVLEPRPGGEPIRSSTPERHMATENPTNAIYQDRQTHSYLPLTTSADTDLSRSGSLSAVSEAGPEHDSFVDVDDDRESEYQPNDPGDDQDLPGENDTSVAPPETGESEPIPAISPEEAHQAPRPSPLAIGAPNPPRPALGENHNAIQLDPQELVKALEQLKKTGDPELDRVLERLGYEKSRPSSSKSKNSSSNQGASSGPVVACKVPNCSATFQRECELRKHMKRHDKPYGCTFKSCEKQFGSKSDWKRHENSQHSPVDMWKCDEYVKCLPGGSPNTQRCDKVCYRRETFKFHLQKEHGYGDTNRINEKLDSCRRGENCGSAFWCGFCVRLIEAKEKDGRWTERYDHIDAHICGRDTTQRRSNEWKHQDDVALSHLDALPSISRRSESGSTSAARSTSGGSGRSSTSSPPTDSSRDKRINDEELSRRAKRTKVGGSSGTAVWFCCNCRYFNSVALVATCGGDVQDCGHVRCSGCEVRESTVEPDLPGVT